MPDLKIYLSYNLDWLIKYEKLKQSFFILIEIIKLHMSLKIIGAGYGRTGTLSTYTALNSLGFPCYHMFEVIENKENKTHLDFWNKVANSPGGQ